MSIELNDISGGTSTVSSLNNNFAKIEDWINLNALWRQGVEQGQANQMEANLDMNGFAILNAGSDLDNPESLLTLQAANSLYVNVSGDSMTGPLSVLEATEASHPVRKDSFDDYSASTTSRINSVEVGYQQGDANIQSQLTGEVPLEASAFSPISWHDQSVDNSVPIPAGKNAWSFGPTMTIAPGQSVTIGEGSFWTIANGEVNQ